MTVVINWTQKDAGKKDYTIFQAQAENFCGKSEEGQGNVFHSAVKNILLLSYCIQSRRVLVFEAITFLSACAFSVF